MDTKQPNPKNEHKSSARDFLKLTALTVGCIWLAWLLLILIDRWL